MTAPKRRFLAAFADEAAKVMPSDVDTKDAEYICKKKADFAATESGIRVKINVAGRIVHFLVV